MAAVTAIEHFERRSGKVDVSEVSSSLRRRADSACATSPASRDVGRAPSSLQLFSQLKSTGCPRSRSGKSSSPSLRQIFTYQGLGCLARWDYMHATYRNQAEVPQPGLRKAYSALLFSLMKSMCKESLRVTSCETICSLQIGGSIHNCARVLWDWPEHSVGGRSRLCIMLIRIRNTNTIR